MRNRLLWWLMKLFGLKAPVILRYKTEDAPRDTEVIAFLQMPQWTFFLNYVKRKAAEEVAAARDKEARNDAALRYAGVERVAFEAEQFILDWKDKRSVAKDMFGSEIDIDVEKFEKKHGELVFVDG